ncbi:unnamed protein product [Moneuplotes crassus]|uniref:Cyclin-like domain-containing protein n=1 Tax=Euplotes crassus TaxID=5936 RepID=A0AAD1UE09_EUPCR|nr:unnamed protein product [Moneuplotes crassus]
MTHFTNKMTMERTSPRGSALFPSKRKVSINLSGDISVQKINIAKSAPKCGYFNPTDRVDETEIKSDYFYLNILLENNQKEYAYLSKIHEVWLQKEDEYFEKKSSQNPSTSLNDGHAPCDTNSAKPEKLCSERAQKYRRIIINFMINLSAKIGNKDDNTLFVAIQLFLIYTSKVKISVKNIQLVACTCMIIAQKYLEIQINCMQDFVLLSKKKFTSRCIIKCEKKILKKLKFKCEAYPSANKFVRLFCDILDIPDPIICDIQVVLMACMYEYKFTCIRSSHLAIAVLKLCCGITLENTGQELLSEDFVQTLLLKYSEKCPDLEALSGSIREHMSRVCDSEKSTYSAIKLKIQ